MLNKIKYLMAVGVALFAVNANANPIMGDTCGVPDRTATMSSAEYCAYGAGNPDGSTVASYYGDTWTNQGEVTTDATNGYLTASSDDGWGNIPNSGDWAIDSTFWDLFDAAVITMHIGNGGGDPDHWAWLMADGATSGTWSLSFINPTCDSEITIPDLGSCTGGGLSNIKLWGVRGSGDTPEPSMLALLAIGLIGVAGARRFKA